MVFVPSVMPEGRETRRSAKALIASMAAGFAAKGLNIEIHEITPAYIYTGTAWAALGLQMPNIFNEQIDDNCAIAICGFWNNDHDDGLVLQMLKGREYLTELNIRPIYDYQDSGREGVDAGYQAWGVRSEGERLTWDFLITTAAYVDCFPLGYIACPEGATDIIR